MNEITDFLLARISEDEETARLGLNQRNELYLDTFDEDESTETNLIIVGAGRLLAECEAKRAIIKLADEATGLDMTVDNDRRVGIRDEAVEPYCGDSILRTLAAVYRDHPDYKPEWKLT